MKELSDYIIEKLSIDDIKTNNSIDDYILKVANLLKKDGFTRIPYENVVADDYIEIFNKKKDRCYTFNKYNILFADTTKYKISPNHMFHIEKDINKYKYNIYSSRGFISSISNIKFFFDMVDKNFDWSSVIKPKIS